MKCDLSPWRSPVLSPKTICIYSNSEKNIYLIYNFHLPTNPTKHLSPPVSKGRNKFQHFWYVTIEISRKVLLQQSDYLCLLSIGLLRTILKKKKNPDNFYFLKSSFSRQTQIIISKLGINTKNLTIFLLFVGVIMLELV